MAKLKRKLVKRRKMNKENYNKYPKTIKYNGKVYQQVNPSIDKDELLKLWQENKLYLFNEE